MSYFINYNECLDTLFKQWKGSYPEEDEKTRFCEDGIMHKIDASINVDELWENASRRVMFCLKDCPDGGAWDTRKMNDEISALKGQFYQRLAKLLYGLFESKPEYRISDGAIDAKMKEGIVKKIWNTQPFAFIETKKLAGGKDCPTDKLCESLVRDEIFLKKEMDILSPNVIVCCDGSGAMFDFITKKEFFGEADFPLDYRYALWNDKKKQEYYHPKYQWHCRLRYYKQRNVVVIDSFHPSYTCENWEFIERVISPFAIFLRDCNPNF
jgi:hypothetical protein